MAEPAERVECLHLIDTNTIMESTGGYSLSHWEFELLTLLGEHWLNMLPG